MTGLKIIAVAGPGAPELKNIDFIRTYDIGTSFGNTVLNRYMQSAK